MLLAQLSPADQALGGWGPLANLSAVVALIPVCLLLSAATRAPALDPEQILEQVELERLDVFTLPEISENGNVIVPGRAELVVTFCADTNEVTVLDLAQVGAAPLGEDLIVSIGNRCYASVVANRERVGRGQCATFLCMPDDSLRRRAMGEPTGERGRE